MTPEDVRPLAKLVRIDTREEIQLDREQTKIGRAGDNDLVLWHMPLVSRHHARIFEYAGGLYLEDLGSSNGTFVNGHRIDRPVHLEEFDRICIGGFVCDYVVAARVETLPMPNFVQAAS